MREPAVTLRSFFGNLRWLRVLLAGLIAALLALVVLPTLPLTLLVQMLYVFSGSEMDREDLDPVVSFWGGSGMEYVLFVLVVFLLSYWVARSAGEAFAAHGTATGIAAAIVTHVIVGFRFPPIVPTEVFLYLLLGAVAGWLGGLRGRTAVARQEALLRAGWEIKDARDAASVAAAIGKQLAGKETVGVALWQAVEGTGPTVDGGSPELELTASWTRRPTDESPPGARISGATPAPVDLAHRRTARVLLPDELVPRFGHPGIARSGARTLFLVPLLLTGDEFVGLLEVVVKKGRRLSGGRKRDYRTVGMQAALALQNLRLLEQGRQAAVVRERQRMAQEIHDTLTQGFTSIVMTLEAGEDALASGHLREGCRQLQAARGTARENLIEARRLVWALGPEALEDDPLPEVLDRIAAGWTEQSGVLAAVSVAGAPRPLPNPIEATVVRAAQESLSNVRKHARASRVALTLTYDDDAVILDIQDDGVGFVNGRLRRYGDGGSTGGFGLASMHERAERLGGVLRVEAGSGGGTAVTLELPVELSEV